MGEQLMNGIMVHIKAIVIVILLVIIMQSCFIIADTTHEYKYLNELGVAYNKEALENNSIITITPEYYNIWINDTTLNYKLNIILSCNEEFDVIDLQVFYKDNKNETSYKGEKVKIDTNYNDSNYLFHFKMSDKVFRDFHKHELIIDGLKLRVNGEVITISRQKFNMHYKKHVN